MAKSQKQKAKVLYLEKMMHETGENRVITMQEILSELLKNGIYAERKSIYDDFDALRSFGMDIRYKRGRENGYYLAGQNVPEKPEEMSDSQQVATVYERNSAVEGRQIKLLFVKEKEEDIRGYFGNLEKYKEKEENVFTASVNCEPDQQFFGWLTMMGCEVKILKPKKVVQEYREYLKNIVKSYK